jgi:hypothetical protein
MGYLRADIAKLVRIVGSISLTPKGYRVQQVALEPKGKADKDFSLNLTCSSCGEEGVKTKNVGAECSHCYDIHPIDKLFTLPGSGGFVCKKGVKLMDDADKEKVVPLSEIALPQNIHF